MVSQSHWQNRDDLRMSMIPRSFQGFWNYESSPTFRLLGAMVRNNRLPRVSILSGPAGSGKTAAAYLLGCAASCEKSDTTTGQGCGICNICEEVRLGKSEKRHGFYDVDCANRGSDKAKLLDRIYEISCETAAYRTAKSGRTERNYIVFLDECQRLTSGERESLLKLTERWAGAHILLATTDLKRLDIPGAAEDKNPLVSRSKSFQFGYPTLAECVAGLTRAASTEGLNLTRDAATWIANTAERQPRQCLGELDTLANFGPDITAKTIQQVYGSQSIKPEKALEAGVFLNL